ncbi:alpha/beta fold hydrolase [Bacillus carboniphilus]|uniref:Alpha/beta fold hydrolase n=1 Tax=Bacillus carboniphilus TaxID=86663 RepID=A0ABY9JSW4_9BACI|nr:alpha/beta fold hydrolase [Bacillus carboniphilus]WLR42489.1 alpha/beta fold hydrolase [Bacillus carboniphilus]
MWALLGYSFSLLTLIVVTTALFLRNLLIYPRTFRYEETFELGIKKGEINVVKYHTLEKYELYIDSKFGYKIHGLLFPLKRESKKAIIIAHGIRWSLFGNVKYIDLFHRLGYHVLTYDQRFHGKSEGSHTSFGFFEKYDMQAWVDYLYKKLGDDAQIGVLGESLGAATALQALKDYPKIAFCIADCAYSNLIDLLKSHLFFFNRLSLSLIIPITSFFTKMFHGWSFKQISPINHLHETNTPILLIHGEKDRIIPKRMSEEMYRKIRGIKQLYIVPNAGHTEAYVYDPLNYESVVKEFLELIEKR